MTSNPVKLLINTITSVLKVSTFTITKYHSCSYRTRYDTSDDVRLDIQSCGYSICFQWIKSLCNNRYDKSISTKIECFNTVVPIGLARYVSTFKAAVILYFFQGIYSFYLNFCAIDAHKISVKRYIVLSGISIQLYLFFCSIDAHKITIKDCFV